MSQTFTMGPKLILFLFFGFFFCTRKYGRSVANLMSFCNGRSVKRPSLPWPRGTRPPNTLVFWKNVYQISVSDIHNGAKIDFVFVLFFALANMAPLQPIYLAFAMRGPSKKVIIAMTLRDGAPKYFGVLEKGKSNQHLRHSHWSRNWFWYFISNWCALANVAANLLGLCKGRSVQQAMTLRDGAQKCKSNQRLRHSQWGQNSFQCLISNLSALANMASMQLIYLTFCSGRSVKRPLLPWPWEMMPHNTLDKK